MMTAGVSINFNGVVVAGYNWKQYLTDLPLANHGSLPGGRRRGSIHPRWRSLQSRAGWKVSGVNALHVVRNGATTLLALYGDNVLASPQIVPNNAGVKFALNVSFAPGTFNDAAAASLVRQAGRPARRRVRYCIDAIAQATDAVVVTLLSAPGKVAFQFTAHQTQPFTGTPVFISQSFNYVGNGAGDLSIEFSCAPGTVRQRICGVVNSAFISMA